MASPVKLVVREAIRCKSTSLPSGMPLECIYNVMGETWKVKPKPTTVHVSTCTGRKPAEPVAVRGRREGARRGGRQTGRA